MLLRYALCMDTDLFKVCRRPGLAGSKFDIQCIAQGALDELLVSCLRYKRRDDRCSKNVFPNCKTEVRVEMLRTAHTPKPLRRTVALVVGVGPNRVEFWE